MKYSNLPLDITDIIKQMKSRGLSITDENKATTFLENVSYFRFAAYLRPMEIDASHNYKSGSTLEAEITAINENGIFVKVPGDIEGLVNKAIRR